jgi:hypothetical protein
MYVITFKCSVLIRILASRSAAWGAPGGGGCAFVTMKFNTQPYGPIVT